MAPGKREKKSKTPIAIVVAIVFIATALLVLRPMPERVVALSQDGIARVEGVTRSSSAAVLRIQRLNGVETSFKTIVGPVYEVSFGKDGRLKNAEVIIDFGMLDHDGFSIQDARIYKFNRSTFTWDMTATLFDLDKQTLSASLDLLGNTMIGVGESVQSE